MNLLMAGDIVGKPGRRVSAALVPELRREFATAMTIANAENCANGSGITAALAQELFPYFDVLTLGDHVWDQKGFETEIKRLPRIVRPANLSEKQPGIGYADFPTPIGITVGVIVLHGKIFMRECANCPFEVVDRILSENRLRSKVIIVDIHAEATSEKIAMGHFLDGRVTAVLGTHTHVQTADAQILPKGTAYMTDLGMTGPHWSVLGRSIPDVLLKFSTGMPNRLPVEEKPPYRLDGAVLDFDPATGLARKITPVSRFWEAE